ncbi:MAG TPA: glycosyltransferase family 39 protein [Polyangiales bacterium]|nr:glycosyltransferase family 39 protein [Polyangiales bacterium]
MAFTPRKLQIAHADLWLTASWLGLLAIVVLAPRLALDSGLSFDEEMQRIYGDLILAWYRSDFQERGALSYWNLYLYGGLFDLTAQWVVSLNVLPWGVYETRHALTALTAVAGVVATWKTAAKLGGPAAGFCAALMLALTPAWVGHGFFNPKDIPFGAAAAFVMYASVSIALRESVLRWGDALRAAVAIGLALAVRPGGMFLGLFPVIAAFGRLAIDEAVRAPRAGIPSLLRAASVVSVRLACMLPVVWSLMLSAWPWAQLEPLKRPFEAERIAAHFRWHGEMLFDGQMIRGGDAPLRYLPVWFARTLPETYWLAAAAGLYCVIAALASRRLDRPRALGIACIALFVLVPYAGVIVRRPTLYDAHRHFLFVLPALGALAGIAVCAAAKHPSIPLRIRVAGVAVWAALAAFVAFDMRALHPYEYVYFNRASGGLPAALGKFETDYWGVSFQEGFDWVVHNIQPREPGTPVKVSSCKRSPGRWQLNYLREHWHLSDRFTIMKYEDEGDVYLGFTRGACQARPGEILHKVERQGVPLLYVLRHW